VVATLQRLLVDETGLLEQVDDHIGSRQLTRGVEIDTDELSKPIKELSILLVDFKHITIYLEELSFLTVFALPQASRTGLVWTILSSREASPSFLFPKEQMVAK
jgi:hypothetical protein